MGRALILLLLLTGCSSTLQSVDDPRTIWCEHETPDRSGSAGKSRAELDRLNAHNAKGALWCGWEP